MLHSVQETKYIFLLLFLLLLLQPTRSLNNTKNKISSGIKVAPKGDKLHFSDLQCIYISIASYIHSSVN